MGTKVRSACALPVPVPGRCVPLCGVSLGGMPRACRGRAAAERRECGFYAKIHSFSHTKAGKDFGDDFLAGRPSADGPQLIQGGTDVIGADIVGEAHLQIGGGG